MINLDERMVPDRSREPDHQSGTHPTELPSPAIIKLFMNIISCFIPNDNLSTLGFVKMAIRLWVFSVS